MNQDRNDMNQDRMIDDTFIRIVQEGRKRSQEKSIVEHEIKLQGGVYPGKTIKLQEFRKTAVQTIAIVASCVTMITVENHTNMLFDYQKQVAEILDEELTESSERVNYQNIQNVRNDSLLDHVREQMSILDDIKEEKKKLKETDDYHLGDQRLHDDAIRKVAEERTYPDIAQAKGL
ncbi:MAG: hypothetical protein PUB18_04395 [bacterium]|nr:hypothetical protein [bacterium]